METLLIFLLVISVLVFVHELGHFLFAKLTKTKVNTFAIGFPPKITSWKWGETEWKLNLIPFGGYVSLHGEEGEVESDKSRAYIYKKWWQKLLILVAGVFFNFIFAVVSFTILYSVGTLTLSDDSDAEVAVVQSLSDSPAMQSGMQSGDVLKSIRILSGESAETVQISTVSSVVDAIRSTPIATVLQIDIQRGETPTTLTVTTTANRQGKSSIGAELMTAKVTELPLGKAFIESVKDSWYLCGRILDAFGTIIGELVRTGHTEAQLSGPVGIAKQLNVAAENSWKMALRMSAVLSLNLAVLNLIPFPAVDGGQIVIVLIEAIRRKRFKPQVVGIINTIGFALLMLLMVVVTIKDIF